MSSRSDNRIAGTAAAVAITVLFGLTAGPNQARAASAPQAPEVLVAQVYHGLIGGETGPKGYEPPETFYTPHLKALVAAARRAAKGEAPCGLDFIFWSNGQEDQITQLVVTRGQTTPAGRTTVTATFRNTGDPEKIVFDFQELGGRWLLDDAHSLVGDSKWTFSRLLQCKD
jgi:hypothetical protein